MSIMKRQLLVEVECGKDTCQECEFAGEDECALFNRYLDDEHHRHIECLAAEEKMLDLIIRHSAAKAAETI